MSTSPITPMSSLPATNLFVPKDASTTASGSSTGTSTSSTGGLAGTSVGTTFLNLLVQELQNQDPSSPMDSTQMVGQMISLNQLDQLISINQNLTPSTSSSASGKISDPTAGSSGSSTAAESSAAMLAARNALLDPSSLSSSSSTAARNAAMLAAANPNTTLNLSSLTNQFGGM